MKKWMILILVFQTWAATAEDTTDLTAFYDGQFVKLGYGMFGGLSVNYQGATYSPMFGLSSTVTSAMKSDPGASPLVGGYQFKNTLGNLFLWGGLVAVVAGEYLYVDSIGHSTYLDQYGNQQYDPSRVSMTGVYIAGFASLAMMVSPFLLGSSLEDLVGAVNTYNRDLMKRAPRP